MIIATIERPELIVKTIIIETPRSSELSSKNFEYLVSKLIAIRREGSDPNQIKDLARRASTYEGIAPDPFNKSRRLNVTRLIATIDRGMYN